MKHPEGPGRIYKKDITYTTPGPRVKDCGIPPTKEKNKGNVFPESPGDPRPFEREC